MKQTVLELARSMEREKAHVDRLMAEVARSLLAGGGPLSDQERALMRGIVTDLVETVAADILGRIGRDEAATGAEPALRAAVVRLSGPTATGTATGTETGTGTGTGGLGRIAEALRGAEVLAAPGLIRLVYARVRAHLLGEALRPPLTGGRGQLAAEMLEPAALQAFQIDDARRIDPYGDPRLPIEDLPDDLQAALHWDIAAALRVALVAGGAGEAGEIDDAIEIAVSAALRQPPPLPEADRLRRQAAIPPDSLVEALQRGEIFLFLMLLGQISGLPLGRVQQTAFGRGDLEFATVCRALAFPRHVFAELHLLVAQQSRAAVRDPEALVQAMRAFDAIDPGEALELLRLWRRHPRYVGAIRRSLGA
ncbi:MAG: DUF2336 domain-containing protein [Alphaproteobacteria bacterium]